VVRQSALEGLAALGSKVTTQRREVVEALTAVEAGPNPELAQKARQMLVHEEARQGARDK
jgi:hypothetical protein